MLKYFTTTHHGSATAEIRAEELQREYEFSLGRSLYPAVNNSCELSLPTLQKSRCVYGSFYFIYCAAFRAVEAERLGYKSSGHQKRLSCGKKMASVPAATLCYAASQMKTQLWVNPNQVSHFHCGGCSHRGSKC